MTTFAYRDGTLAADAKCSIGNRCAGYAVKALKMKGVLAAAMGDGGRCQVFLDWVRTGCRDLPKIHRDDENDEHQADGFIYTPDGREVSFWGSTPPQWMRAPFFAHGSGAEIALGAMAMGATAEQAIRVAAAFDNCTGGPITVLRA